MSTDRLQKILARAGVASRRAAEAIITAGRVRVNGRVVTELGAQADARRDRIEVDGQRIVAEKPVYVLLHKPRGMVATMSDPEGRPNVGELVQEIGARAFPVGRLDFHTSGALLLTNDGDLADALMHPRRGVPKVYVAKVRAPIEVEALQALRTGVVLDDGDKTAPAEVFVLREGDGHAWLQITLYEGKNRQIHRMGEAVGHPVLRLARLSFAGLDTEGLKPGQWRELGERELGKLKQDYLTPSRRGKANDARRAAGLEVSEEPDPYKGADPRGAPKHAPKKAETKKPRPKSGAQLGAEWEASADRAKPAGARRPPPKPRPLTGAARVALRFGEDADAAAPAPTSRRARDLGDARAARATPTARPSTRRATSDARGGSAQDRARPRAPKKR